MKQLFVYSLLISTSYTLIGMNEQPDIYALAQTALYAYKQYIVTTLPHEICKQIDNNSALLDGKIIKESCIKNILQKGEQYHDDTKPKLMISNNGLYFTHNIAFELGDSKTKLIDIQNRKAIYDFYGRGKSIQFSPNNHYCITNEVQGVYIFNIIERTKQLLIENLDWSSESLCYGITISNNSKHILLEGRHYGSKEKYNLWSRSEYGALYPILLQNDLLHSKAVAFHPNNRQIIHSSHSEKLKVIDIDTDKTKTITSDINASVHYIDSLNFKSDNTKILARTQHTTYGGPIGHILLDITNLDSVTSVSLPQQSCHQPEELPMLCIPNKKMLTHITNNGGTLELISENAALIATHHAKKTHYISALAVDNTGNYLASGYSDGTIMIWHLYGLEPCNYEKTIITTAGVIKSLTFGSNQLLFSTSQPGVWDSTENSTNRPSSAILWDVYGNEIINFGHNIAAIMSPNGKNIITAALTMEWNHNIFNLWQHIITLSAWNIRNEHTKQLFKERKNSLTLSQMFILNGQHKKNNFS